VYALHHPSELAALGAQGSLNARQHWTWDHAYAVLKERIAALSAKPIKRFEQEKRVRRAAEHAPQQEDIFRSIDAVVRSVEQENTAAALNEIERIMMMVEQRMNPLQKQRILTELSALRTLIGQAMQQPAPDPMLETAERLLSEEKTAEARILLKELLKRDPENIDILNDLAVAGIMEKDYGEAAQCLKAVIDRDPVNETAIGNLEYLKGMLAASLGDSAIQAAESLIEDGETAKARIILQEVLLANPDHIDALNDLSVVEIMEKNWREAAVLIDKVVTLDPSNASAKQNLQCLDQAVTDRTAGPGKEA
nr:tetratricopeptide repeat protein [Bacteroidota bacterium]